MKVTAGTVPVLSTDVFVIYRDYYNQQFSAISAGNIGTYSTGVQPTDFTFDPSRNIWVAHYFERYVTKLSPSGEIVGTYGILSSAYIIEADPSGNIWVLYYEEHYVTKLSPTGELIGTYNINSYGEAIDFDSKGNAWVACRNDRVCKISPSGILEFFSVGDLPRDIAVDANDNVWVANYNDVTVSKISPTGSVTTYNHSNQYYDWTRSIAIDSDGNVWVVHTSGGVGDTALRHRAAG